MDCGNQGTNRTVENNDIDPWFPQRSNHQKDFCKDCGNQGTKEFRKEK